MRKHYLGPAEVETIGIDVRSPVHHCRAFEHGIPAVITEERFDHRRPHRGDHRIRFDPLNDAAAKLVEEIFSGE